MLIAGVYGALGDNEKALALLEEAYRTRPPGYMLLMDTLPQLDSLRSDPRYRNLRRQIGLPPN